MRKALSTIVLALGLTVGGTTAAQATGPGAGGGPLPPCSTVVGAGTPCAPDQLPSCSSAVGAGTPCVPDQRVAELAAAQAKIARQHQRIERQARIIKRLRHRLATR